ncbi:MAG: YceD family protein [Pseudomonadota bacterium]
MPANPPPQRVIVRKAVSRRAAYSGVLGVAELPSVASVLDPSTAGVEASICFAVDDEGRSIAQVSVSARVTLECQRCLELFSTTLEANSTLGLLVSESQASELPENYDPWVTAEEADLWEMIAEEVALALPTVAYHAEQDCSQKLRELSETLSEKGDGSADANRSSPFDVLGSLLRPEAGGTKDVEPD